jgi:hypothetical protein
MPRKKKTHQTDPNGVRDFRHADGRQVHVFEAIELVTE